MSDITCPSCLSSEEINHDGGVGYVEDVMHEQGCSTCGCYFKFTTSISYDYKVFCGDKPHKLEALLASKYYSCQSCDFIGTLEEIEDGKYTLMDDE